VSVHLKNLLYHVKKITILSSTVFVVENLNVNTTMSGQKCFW